jgi:hypothetical protein
MTNNNKNIKSFEQFLNEDYFGIGAQQYGQGLGAGFGYSEISGVGAGINQPKDPELSFDAQDTFKNNLKDQINRFVNISKSIFNYGNYNYGYDFISEIEDLYIVKMYSNNNGLLDIYIRFTLEEEIFYGKFENWGGINKPTFTSKVLFLPVIYGYKDNALRLFGLIEETLNDWFRPKDGCFYRALKEVTVYTRVGTQFTIPLGGKIEIDNITLSNNKPVIYLKYSDNNYTLSGIDYYFFNWWFKKEEEKEFYL